MLLTDRLGVPIFKSSYETEKYCKVLLPVTHRAAFAKFRCGVAPIRLETGRFENLNVDQRLCHFCNDAIEDETHVVLFCSAYEDLRNNLVSKAVSVLSNFSELSAKEKMKFLFTKLVPKPVLKFYNNVVFSCISSFFL